MEYIKLKHRSKKIKEKYLVTNDYFNWLFLDKEDFKAFEKDEINKNSRLYRLLEDEAIIISKDTKALKHIISRKSTDLNNILKGPSLHIIVLTKRCQQKCIYCHASSANRSPNKRLDLNKENAKRFVELIYTTPSNQITIEFQGGEPLLNFSVLKLIREYSGKINKKFKKDVNYSIVTNLEDMDKQKLDYLIEKKISICTSLDGSKSLHDKNRPSSSSSSSYEKVIHWIKEIRKRGGKVSALCTLSNKSLRYGKQIVDEYVENNLDSIHLRDLNFLGNAIGNWDKIGYSADEFLSFWKDTVDYMIRLNLDGINIRERTCSILLSKIIQRKDPLYLDIMSPCGGIIGQIAYNYNGKIFTCDEARTFEEEIFQIGDISDASSKNVTIPKILDSDEARSFTSVSINDSYYCDYCVYKSYCGVCPVCNYRETGNVITDVLRTRRCKILTGIFDYLFEKLQDEKSRKILEKWAKD